MSTKQKTPADVGPTSLRDAGYRFAGTGDSLRTLARYVFGECPTILDSTPDNVRDEIRSGFQLRKHEITPAQNYKMGDGGKYIPLTPEQATKTEGVVCMTINAAMSYSSQEFGKMRQADPARYEIIKPMRDAFSTYASNKMADLMREIRNIANEGKTRARAANKDWDEVLKSTFDALEAKAKTLKTRGDTRADPVKFLVARDAFLKSYNS